MNKNYVKVRKHLLYKLSKVWNLGDRIDSVAVISAITKVSYYYTRKAIEYMIGKGYLESRGLDGIWVISKPTEPLSKVMSKIQLIDTYKRYIKAANMLSDGALFDRKSTSIIIRKSDVATFYFPYTGKENVVNINAVQKLLTNPIYACDINCDDKNMLQEYALQQQAREVLPIVLRNRKKLGVTL